jgi:hypothetical protein
MKNMTCQAKNLRLSPFRVCVNLVIVTKVTAKSKLLRFLSNKVGTETNASINFEKNTDFFHYDTVRNAILKYKEIHGSINTMPKGFQIPNDSTDWPENMKRMYLGSLVYNMKKRYIYASKKDDLISIGFSFGDNSNKDRSNSNRNNDNTTETYKFNIIKDSFVQFKELYGHLEVPYTFIIPNNSEWNEKLWNIKLGNIVNDITFNELHDDKNDELLLLGFSFCIKKSFTSYNIEKSALLEYNKIYGNMDVLESFVISKDDKWSSNLWGVKLGNIVYCIKNHNYYANKKKDFNFWID